MSLIIGAVDSNFVINNRLLKLMKQKDTNEKSTAAIKIIMRKLRRVKLVKLIFNLFTYLSRDKIDPTAEDTNKYITKLNGL